MSEATAKYWAARCRRGTPPGPGSPCAALLWATDEIERLRTRDEAAAAVVRAWARVRTRVSGSQMADALDALARAHADEGQDR
jgi:hypothetical protein